MCPNCNFLSCRTLRVSFKSNPKQPFPVRELPHPPANTLSQNTQLWIIQIMYPPEIRYRVFAQFPYHHSERRRIQTLHQIRFMLESHTDFFETILHQWQRDCERKRRKKSNDCTFSELPHLDSKTKTAAADANNF